MYTGVNIIKALEKKEKAVGLLVMTVESAPVWKRYMKTFHPRRSPPSYDNVTSVGTVQAHRNPDWIYILIANAQRTRRFWMHDK